MSDYKKIVPVTAIDQPIAAEATEILRLVPGTYVMTVQLGTVPVDVNLKGFNHLNQLISIFDLNAALEANSNEGFGVITVDIPSPGLIELVNDNAEILAITAYKIK